MACAILAGAMFLLGASLAAMPVSTTHAIVGAVLGMTLISVGARCVAWTGLAAIAASWVASPLLAGLLSASLHFLLQRHVFQVRQLSLDVPSMGDLSSSLHMPGFAEPFTHMHRHPGHTGCTGDSQDFEFWTHPWTLL